MDGWTGLVAGVQLLAVEIRLDGLDWLRVCSS